MECSTTLVNSLVSETLAARTNALEGSITCPLTEAFWAKAGSEANINPTTTKSWETFFMLRWQERIHCEMAEIEQCIVFSFWL
jgi:hypothetical protein